MGKPQSMRILHKAYLLIQSQTFQTWNAAVKYIPFCTVVIRIDDG
jgi:hypothetical protein